MSDPDDLRRIAFVYAKEIGAGNEADLLAAADHIDALTAERDEARADLAELTGRLESYVERNHDDGGTHAEALDSLIADAERYSEACATLDAIAALVGPGDVVERVRALVQHDREHLADLADLAAVMRKP